MGRPPEGDSPASPTDAAMSRSGCECFPCQKCTGAALPMWCLMLRPWIAQVRSETNKKKTNEYYGNSRENGEAGNQHKSIKRALCVCNNLNIFVRPYLILLFITRMQTQLYIENHFVWLFFCFFLTI